MKRLLCALQLVIMICVSLTGTAPLSAQSLPVEAGQDVTVYLPLVWQEPPLVNAAVSVIDPAATGSASTFHTPLDATPDPDGNQFYFTAMSAQGAAVFKTPATGGTVVTITVGSPLTMPIGLVVSTDGQTLYVADLAATVGATQTLTSTGAIFSVPSSGGVSTPLTTTLGTTPRGLTLIRENNADMIYFTGSAPDTGEPAILKVPASGGPLTVVERGGDLVEPTGIAVAQNGDIYVADPGADSNGGGALYRFKHHDHRARPSHNELLATQVRFGSPAGITLTFDESLLLASTLQPISGTSQVLIINTATKAHALVNKVIGVNQASGGLHRAHNNNEMAWCGVTAGTGGQGIVYRVSLGGQ